MLCVTTICVESIFLFLLFISYNFLSDSSLAFIGATLLCVITPFAAIYSWKKEVEKSANYKVQTGICELPYSPKINMLGAELILETDRICWRSKQNYENRHIIYDDIQEAEVTWAGAYILKLTKFSGGLKVNINLSLCQKEEWPKIINTIVAHAPNITINDLAANIKEGQVPYF